MRVNDVAGNICQGSKCVSMAWRAISASPYLRLALRTMRPRPVMVLATLSRLCAPRASARTVSTVVSSRDALSMQMPLWHITLCFLRSAAVQGLTDSARHVIGCHLTQDTRVHNVVDDVASILAGATWVQKRRYSMRRSSRPLGSSTLLLFGAYPSVTQGLTDDARHVM